MNVSFLSSEVEDVKIAMPDLESLGKAPTKKNLADDFSSFRNRAEKKKAQVIKPEPKEEEPSEPKTEQEEKIEAPDIEKLRGILHVYVSFWPDRLPQYTHKSILDMNYDQLKEARAIFDCHIGSLQTAQSLVGIFYNVIGSLEQVSRPFLNLDGLAECCKINKDIDDDVKCIAIKIVERNNVSPFIRLALNVAQVAYGVHRYHQAFEKASPKQSALTSDLIPETQPLHNPFAAPKDQ